MEELERKRISKNKKLSPTDPGINHSTDSQSDLSWGSPVSSFEDSKIKSETPKSKIKASISKILGSGTSIVLRFGREKGIRSEFFYFMISEK
jgi:hypothetical protein